MDLDHIVKKLSLKNHPEGGFFAESYRSSDQLDAGTLAPWHGLTDRTRSISTAIYYLLAGKDFSAFHKIKSDECWHFYLGASFEIIEITPAGNLIKTILGTDIKAGEIPQYVVKAGHWFGSRLLDPTGNEKFGLVGCTVAPGFDFKDFIMGSRDQLRTLYPEHHEIITAMTR